MSIYSTRKGKARIRGRATIGLNKISQVSRMP
jgi:hypothetical protein